MKADEIEIAVKIVFVNDPFCILAEAFNNLYPNLKYRAQFVPKIIDDEGKEVFGETFFPDDDDDTPIIGVSCNLKILEAVEIFAHELAHVAVPNEEHSDAWEDAYNKIFNEYNRIATERQEEANK